MNSSNFETIFTVNCASPARSILAIMTTAWAKVSSQKGGNMHLGARFIS